MSHTKYQNLSLYLSRQWLLDKEGNPMAASTLQNDKNRIRKKILSTVTGTYIKDGLGEYWKRRNKITRTGEVVLTLSSPLTVGMGEGLPVDIPGITIHRHYNFPYIPASSVRGMVRHLVSMTKEHGMTSGTIKEPKVFTAVERLLFGNYFDGTLKPARSAGIVHFLPAVPVEDENDVFDRDIINSHHQPYYTGKNPPMDTYKPNIVYFIRVKPGTKFHFGWVIDKNYRDRWEHARHLSDEEVVDKPLDDAILAFFGNILETLRILDKDITGSTEQEHINSGIELLIRITGELIGFGAKTRLGYGRLK